MRRLQKFILLVILLATATFGWLQVWQLAQCPLNYARHDRPAIFMVVTPVDQDGNVIEVDPNEKVTPPPQIKQNNIWDTYMSRCQPFSAVQARVIWQLSWPTAMAAVPTIWLLIWSVVVLKRRRVRLRAASQNLVMILAISLLSNLIFHQPVHAESYHMQETWQINQYRAAVVYDDGTKYNGVSESHDPVCLGPASWAVNGTITSPSFGNSGEKRIYNETWAVTDWAENGGVQDPLMSVWRVNFMNTNDCSRLYDNETNMMVGAVGQYGIWLNQRSTGEGFNMVSRSARTGARSIPKSWHVSGHIGGIVTGVR